MTKVGILSDTHGELLPQVLRFLEPCQCLWHAGDLGGLPVLDRLSAFKPTLAVYGNIDDYLVRLSLQERRIFECEGCKIAMTHIGGYPGHYAPGVLPWLEAEKPDLFISGHSHILKVMPDKKHGWMHINPGAAGNKGFHAHITAVRLDIDGKKLSNLEVFDLDRTCLGHARTICPDSRPAEQAESNPATAGYHSTTSNPLSSSLKNQAHVQD